MVQAEQEPTPAGSVLGPAQAAPAFAGEQCAMENNDGVSQTQEEKSDSGPDLPVVNAVASQPLTPHRTPPSTPTSVIRDYSVPPPVGMLVSNDIQVFPPSSQSSIPSPSPQPNYRLLNPPRSGDDGVSTGPTTRSRSPMLPAAKPVRRKSSRKAAGGR